MNSHFQFTFSSADEIQVIRSDSVSGAGEVMIPTPDPRDGHIPVYFDVPGYEKHADCFMSHFRRWFSQLKTPFGHINALIRKVGSAGTLVRGLVAGKAQCPARLSPFGAARWTGRWIRG